MTKNKKVGRPRKIKSAAEFCRLANAYLNECEAQGARPLLTGLILALGLSSRESLDNYAQRPEFAEVVQMAKLNIEMSYEKMLAGGGNTSGAVFALKNFRWSDKHEVEHSGGLLLKDLVRELEA